MPVAFYTLDEVQVIEQRYYTQGMKLAQALAEAKGFPCIREPDNAGPDGPGDYCTGCPAEESCPYQFKRLAP